MHDTVTFSPDGRADYLYWQTEDRKTLRRINALIQAIFRSGLTEGLGSPEALRHVRAWSRRIDEKNRLVYVLQDDTVIIISCRRHYDDR